MEKKENKVYEITTEKQLKAILKLNLITVVKFETSWCRPCQKTKPLFDKLPKKYNNAVFLSIDIDNAEELRKIYHIKALPTFILMAEKGEFDRVLGPNLDKVTNLLDNYKPENF